MPRHHYGATVHQTIWFRDSGCLIAELNRLKTSPGRNNAALSQRIPGHLSGLGAGFSRGPALADFKFLILSARAAALAPDRAAVAFLSDADDVKDISLRVGPVSEADLVTDSNLLRHGDLVIGSAGSIGDPASALRQCTGARGHDGVDGSGR